MRWLYTVIVLTALCLGHTYACLDPDSRTHWAYKIDDALDAGLNNHTSAPRMKRWLRRNGGRTFAPTSQTNGNQWSIVYCFSSTVTAADQSTLKNWIDRAWQTWIVADSTQPYQIDHLSLAQGSLQACSNGQSTNVLGVTTNTQGTAYTNTNLDNRAFLHPYINIDINYAQNHPRGAITVLAHEIGHAWGLEHEHQRADAVRGLPQSVGNGRLTFDCTALADWALLGSPAVASRLCTSVNAAYDAGFSARQFIPWIQPTSSTRYSTNPDYNSIMMYDGQAGAKPLTGPGSVNGLAVVFADTQNNNAPFVASNKPSSGDIAGLAGLYPKTGAAPLGGPGVSPSDDNGIEGGSEAVQCFVGSIQTITQGG